METPTALCPECGQAGTEVSRYSTSGDYEKALYRCSNQGCQHSAVQSPFVISRRDSEEAVKPVKKRGRPRKSTEKVEIPSMETPSAGLDGKIFKIVHDGEVFIVRKSMFGSFLALAFLGIFAASFPVMGQTNPSPTIGAKLLAGDQFFIEASGGTFLGGFRFQHFNRPDNINRIPAQINTTLAGPTGFCPLIAGGIDFPDRFSLLVSCEWLTDTEWAALVHAQFVLADLDFMRPYFQGGLGPDFSSSLGFAVQLGLGMDFPLAQEFDLLVGAKALVAYNEWNSPINILESYQASRLYLPLTVGVKVTL